MPAWVAVAIGAAFLQNLRSALQRTLTPRAGVLGATYARFLFAAPLAAGLVAVLALRQGGGLPRITPGFVAWGLTGAVMQIAATLMLLAGLLAPELRGGQHLRQVRDRAGGAVRPGAARRPARRAGDGGDRREPRRDRAALDRHRGRPAGVRPGGGLGLASGTAFALSAVAYRGAALALEGAPGALMRPAFTLACVTLVQTVLMGAWLAVAAPGAIRAMLRGWRLAAPVGAAGMLASLGWFVAFTFASAAEVKAVGQVELLFSWLTARYAFGELPSLRETVGIALVAGGIVLVVLAG